MAMSYRAKGLRARSSGSRTTDALSVTMAGAGMISSPTFRKRNSMFVVAGFDPG